VRRRRRGRRGQGTVYRRGPVYWIEFPVPGRSRWKESAQTEDKAAAEILLRKRLVERDSGALPDRNGSVVPAAHPNTPESTPTFEEARDVFYADMRTKGCRSFEDAKRRVEKHLARMFAGRLMDSISPTDIRRYQAMRLDEGATNGGVRREMAALKRMFRLLLHDERLSKVPNIPMPAEGKPRQGFFEREDLDRLLPYLPSWLRPPVVFAYNLGWRMRSEVFSIEWRQVDLVHGTVRLEPGQTKSGKGRLVYLWDEPRAVVEQQWHEHRELFPDCPFVFHRYGSQIRQPLESWRKACNAAGLPGRLMHDFRRTAARNLLRDGVDQSTAMQILGHETAEVFRRYAIKDERVLREAAEKLSRAANQRSKPQVSRNAAPGNDTQPTDSTLTH
jgi:integrase